LQTHSFGDYHFRPYAVYPSISAAASASDCPEDGWDYVVVTTKALPDVTDDSKDIEPLVRKGGPEKTCIVLIQNGVGIEEAHRQRFPANPIVSTVTIISAEQLKHGVVRQNRWTRISMGPYSDGLGGNSQEAKKLNEKGAECVQQLCQLFAKIGKIRDAENYDEIALQQVRWHKICINASFNPSSVLSGGVGNADMVMDPELREHIRGVMDEVFVAVPRILGVSFPDKLASPERILKSTERNTGSKPSMLLDWEANRPMELEVILGNPIRIARRHGVEMPRMQTLYALLKSAQGARKKLLNVKDSKI
jgi:2-dehydropantoate 2-reductase